MQKEHRSNHSVPKKYDLKGAAKMSKIYARRCHAHGHGYATGYADAIAEMREEINNILDVASSNGEQPDTLGLLLTNFQNRQEKFLSLIHYKSGDTPDISF